MIENSLESIKRINEPATNSKKFSGNDSNNTSDENIPKIWVRIPFLGKQGEYLVKKTY